MSPAQQLLEYSKDIEERQKQTREKVLESYKDISLGNGRNCNEFFNELEKRYIGVEV